MPARIKEKPIMLAEYRCDLCENFFWIEDNGVVPETIDCPFCNGKGWLNEDKIKVIPGGEIKEIVSAEITYKKYGKSLQKRVSGRKRAGGNP